jgi:hypothetical protein
MRARSSWVGIILKSWKYDAHDETTLQCLQMKMAHILPMNQLLRILGLATLLLLAGCSPSERWQFEDAGGFKFPESFVVQSFQSSPDIQLLSGTMAPAQALALVQATPGFVHAQPGPETASWKDLNYLRTFVYQMKKMDQEREILYHLDVRTGTFDGYVTFIYGGGGGSFSSPWRGL